MLKEYVLFLFSSFIFLLQSDFGMLAQIVKNIIYRLRQFVGGENNLGGCG